MGEEAGELVTTIQQCRATGRARQAAAVVQLQGACGRVVEVDHVDLVERLARLDDPGC